MAEQNPGAGERRGDGKQKQSDLISPVCRSKKKAHKLNRGSKQPAVVRSQSVSICIARQKKVVSWDRGVCGAGCVASVHFPRTLSGPRLFRVAKLVGSRPSRGRKNAFDVATAAGLSRCCWFRCCWFHCSWFHCCWFHCGWFRCGWFRCCWFRCGWFRCSPAQSEKPVGESGDSGVEKTTRGRHPGCSSG